MRRSMRGLLVGGLSALVVFGLWMAGAFAPLERVSFDLLTRIDARNRAIHEDIEVVLLDQKSLDWASDTMGLDWPWPRELYAAMVSYFARAEAETVAADIVFLDDSPRGVADDRAFGSAIEAYGRFIAAAVLGRETGSFRKWPQELGGSRLRLSGSADWLTPPEKNAAASPDGGGAAGSVEHGRAPGALRFSRAAFPIPPVRDNAALLGNVRGSADPDGVYRRSTLFGVFDGQLVPTLGAAPYVLAQSDGASGSGDVGATVRVEPGTIHFAGRNVPVDERGRAILRYKGGLADRAYSAAAVLQSEIRLRGGGDPPIDPETFRGKHVLVGFSAPGLLDLKPTPLSPNAPGVYTQATLLDNLMTDDFLHPMAWWLTLIVLLLLAAATGVGASLVSGAGRSTAVYAVAVPVPALIAWGLFSAGWLFPFAAVETAVIVSLVASGLVNYATEGRQKRYIKNAFQQYLSPAVIEQLIQHPERLRLGGERRELSIYFSDIQGFTTLSERLSPEELTAFLNDYLTAMTEIVQEEGGTVDKYEGDAIIAFWNAPLDVPDHAQRAVRAALRCQQRLAEMRERFRDRVGTEPFMRIGLNTGPAVVGNMGSRTRFDYTMLGDAVNLAARLEGVNKEFGTYTMISEDTKAAIDGAFPCRELSRIAVVGRHEPVRVYEPWLPEEYESAKPRLEHFERALGIYYEGRFEEAERVFREIADEDRTAAIYAERCRKLAADPPDSWSGVWTMLTK